MEYLSGDFYTLQLGIGAVIAVILGVVCMTIGKKKGRSAVGCFFLGFFLSLIGLIITLVLKPKAN